MKHSYKGALAGLTLLVGFPVGIWGQEPSARATAMGPSLTVEQAVDQAMLANPQIRAGVRRLSLAQTKTATARSLDDPMLMVRDWGTPLKKPWDLNQAQMMFAVQQTFVSKEKRNLRGKVAEDAVEVASEDLESLRQEVAAEVRQACSVLLRNADEMRLHDEQTAVLKQALSAALAEYTTGKTAQSEVLKAQMALTRLNEHWIELEEERDAARAQLNVSMGRGSAEPVEITGGYRSAEGMPGLEDLERIALEHRPELQGLRKEIAKGGDESRLARMASKPDVTVAAGYMLGPAGSAYRNGYMAELTMNLPGWNRTRHESEAKQADAATEVTRAELDARTSAVFLEIRQAQIAVQAAQRRVKLYRDTLLPQAEADFKATTSAYTNSRGEFANLVESQNLLLDVRTAYFKALAAEDAGGAQLERAIGAPLSETVKNSNTDGRQK